VHIMHHHVNVYVSVLIISSACWRELLFILVFSPVVMMVQWRARSLWTICGGS